MVDGMRQRIEGDPELDEDTAEAVFIYERIADGDCIQTNMSDEQVIEILTLYLRKGKTVH